jgi:hypothetical protein
MTIEAQNQHRIKELETELSKTRESAAMIVHALNCAMQLIEVLIAYTPDNTPLHPGVGTAKGALDEAMRAIYGRAREPIDE